MRQLRGGSPQPRFYISKYACSQLGGSPGIPCQGRGLPASSIPHLLSRSMISLETLSLKADLDFTLFLTLFALDPTELPLPERNPQTSPDQKGSGRDVKEASEHKPQPKSVLRHIIRTIESRQMVDIFYLISASCQEGWEGKLYHASHFTNDETPIYLFVQSASQQTFIKHLFNS